MALQHTLTVYINPTTNPTTHEANTALTNVASNATYTADGVLVFDEVAKLLYVKGVAYGLSATQATDLSTALSTANTLKGSDTGKSARTIASEVSTADIAAALGGSIGAGKEYATVTAAITAALDAASAASTAASTAQSTADAKISNVTGYKTGTTTDDLIDVTVNNHVANVKSKSALTDAVAAANAALPKGTGGTYSTAAALESGIIGAGTTAAQGATELGNNTWSYNEEKSLSHLKDLINTITGGSTVDLAGISATIAKIEDEIENGNGDGYVGTLLDAYKALASANGNYTVGTATNLTTLQGIITALETEISAADTKAGKHSVVTDGVEGNATAGTTNYAVVTSSESNGQTTYTVKTTDALDTVASNASSALSTANAALPKGSSSYANAGALESGLKGNASTDTASSTTIEGAKKYADNAATTAADAVISWNVIGAS